MTQKKLIVFTTYACHPQLGSEPGHGWGFLLIAARLAGLHGLKCICFTLSRFIEPIQNELERLDLLQNVELVSVPIPAYFDKPENGFLLRIGYIIWCSRTRNLIKKLSQSQVQIIHHTNYASEVLPNPIPRRTFESALRIIGPLGSTQNLRVSKILIRDFRDVLIFFMDFLRSALSRVLFGFFVSSKTKVIFNSETLLRKLRGREKISNTKISRLSLVYPSIILNDSKEMRNQKHSPSGVYHVAIVSVFNRRKKVDFALEVLKQINLTNFYCDIYGVGPEHENLRKISTRLNLESIVTWKGMVARAELRNALAKYDAILHPSVREGASTITGEAIVAGIPIVVFEDTGAASTLNFIGMNQWIVPTKKARNRNELILRFAAVLLKVLGRRVDYGNPFSPEKLQNEVEKWYELDK